VAFAFSYSVAPVTLAHYAWRRWALSCFRHQLNRDPAGRVRATERAGFCRHSWSRPWAEITRVTVIGRHGEKASHGCSPGLSALRARNDNGVSGSRRDTPLLSVNRSLMIWLDDSRRGALHRSLSMSPSAGFVEHAQKVSSNQLTSGRSCVANTLNGQVIVEYVPDGVTLNVPPRVCRGRQYDVVRVGCILVRTTDFIGICGTIANGLPSLSAFAIFACSSLIGVCLVLLGIKSCSSQGWPGCRRRTIDDLANRFRS